MRIDEVLKDSKPLAIKFGNAVLNVEYRPANWTINRIEQLKADAENTDNLVTSLQEIVTGWDLTRPMLDETGQPVRGEDGLVIEIPIDITSREDVKEYVGTEIITRIIKAVREDNHAGEA